MRWLTEAIDICKEEEADEESSFKREVDGRGNSVDPLHSRTLYNLHLLIMRLVCARTLHAALLIVAHLFHLYLGLSVSENCLSVDESPKRAVG